MPEYCYRTNLGVLIEREYPMGKAPKTIRIRGKVAHRDFNAEQCPKKDLWGKAPGGWPMVSHAMGVAPKRIPEQVKKAKEAGIPTNFQKTGEPILTSESHRRKYGRLVGAHDCDCYNW